MTDLDITKGDLSAGGFDGHHPPSAELVSDCVHCGFCLPTCPTYLLWGEEMDSPRGRIHLMKQVLEGEPLDDAAIGHFDACLGCMSCVTACPSGVQYDALIEATRGQVERAADRPPVDRALRRLVFSLFPYPRRLRAAARAAARLPAQRGRRLAAPPRSAGPAAPEPRRDGRTCCRSSGRPNRCRRSPRRSATGGRGSGCCSAACSASSSRGSTPRRCGCWPPRAARSSPRRGSGAAVRCRCTPAGSPRRSAGRSRLIATFESQGVDAIVVNAAGCGSAMKDYGRLLADDPHWARAGRGVLRRSAVDVSELLAALGPVADPAPAAGRRGLPRRVPSRARPGRPGAAARPARRDPGARGARDRRAGDLLRLGRRLQPAQPGAGPRARRPQGRQRGRDRRRRCSSPRTPAA